MKLCIVLSVAIASILIEVQSQPLREEVWSAAYAYPTNRVVPMRTAIGAYDWPFAYPQGYPLVYPGQVPLSYPYAGLDYYPMTEVVIEREDPDKKIEHKEEKKEEKIEEHKEEEHKEEEHKEEHKEEPNEHEHKEEEHKKEEHKEEEKKEE